MNNLPNGLPDLSNPGTRRRLIEHATELVAELPREPGEALTVLAIMLGAACARAGVDPAALIKRVCP